MSFHSHSYTPHFIIFHFVFAYALISSRPWKLYYRLDHNVSPRGDTTKYGPKAVAEGKLSQERLNQIIRVEGAHANSIENYPLFVGSLLLGHISGVEISTLNSTALAYTIIRIFYAIAYICISDAKTSWVRGGAWWMGNLTCLRLVWVAGGVMNG